jgi:hypothetical protein
MSEETQNEGTWSGLKKTIIGTLSTAVLAGGTWFTTTLFGGHEEESKEDEISYQKIDTSNHDIPPVWDFHGLEDVRVFRWDDIF